MHAHNNICCVYCKQTIAYITGRPLPWLAEISPLSRAKFQIYQYRNVGLQPMKFALKLALVENRLRDFSIFLTIIEALQS